MCVSGYVLRPLLLYTFINIERIEVKVICVPSVRYCVDADITDVMELSPDRGLVL